MIIKMRFPVMLLLLFELFGPAIGNEVIGCGGFIKSNTEINYKIIKVFQIICCLKFCANHQIWLVYFRWNCWPKKELSNTPLSHRQLTATIWFLFTPKANTYCKWIPRRVGVLVSPNLFYWYYNKIFKKNFLIKKSPLK